MMKLTIGTKVRLNNSACDVCLKEIGRNRTGIVVLPPDEDNTVVIKWYGMIDEKTCLVSEVTPIVTKYKMEDYE
jgi:hypothetical protein